MGTEGFIYKFVFMAHILLIVVGFGTSFAWPMMAAKARKLTPPEAYAINSSVQATAKILTTYMIYGAILAGIVLVAVSDGTWKFSQLWISIAFLLVIISLCIATFLHTPNLKAMVALQEKLVSGQATPSEGGGPPKEVLELQERGPKAGLYGGVLHLLFLLLVIDMIWKPGLGV